MLAENKRRDEVERERRIEEKREREEEMQRREEVEKGRREEEARNNRAQQQQLIERLMERRADPVRASPPAIFDLPRMRDSNELEEFISVFETALKVNEVLRGLWKQKLLTHLPRKALVRMEDTLQTEGSSYKDTVGALRGSTAMSFCSAAEDLCSGERGRVYEMKVCPSLARLKHLVKTVAGEAESMEEMAESFAVALARDHFVPSLKHM